MGQPFLDVQSGHSEIDIKFSSFDSAALEAALEKIKQLRFETFSLGKLLIQYGDPTKTDPYRFGVRIPKNVEAEPFTNWLVEQLRTLQMEDGSWLKVNQLPASEWTRK